MSVDKKIQQVFDFYVKPRLKKGGVKVLSYRNGTLYLDVHPKIKDPQFLQSLANIFCNLVEEVEEVKNQDYKDIVIPYNEEVPFIGIELESLDDDWK